MHLSSSPTKEFQQQQSVLIVYQGHLKQTYHAMSIVSKQGWIDRSNMKDLFDNVTIIKSRQKIGLDFEYTTSSQEILDNQIQSTPEVFKMYNKLFETFDSRKRQLIVLEGNAGTGKTTLAYKVCKEWAEGNVLLQYSHVILLQLRDIKSGSMNKPEQLFDAMGKLNETVYAEMAANYCWGVLLWLEGWDELASSLRLRSIFMGIASGKILPLATLVISTRPSATGSLKEVFNNFTHNFKLVGFTHKQIEEYVHYYCLNSNLAERFLMQLKHVPSLAQLAEVPLTLAILVKLFKKTKDLPNSLTEIYDNCLMNILQHHKEKNLRDTQLFHSTNRLPSKMQKIFDVLTKHAFECLFYHESFSEEEISEALFDSSCVPLEFDGLGLFKIEWFD